jgi:fluoride exporter
VSAPVATRPPVHKSTPGQLHWTVLLAIAAGGVLGSEARYGVDVLLPHDAHGFPTSTVVVNVVGCLLIGVLTTVLLTLTSPHRLARPFLGVGVLGGFTTFSTFGVDTQRLLAGSAWSTAAVYVVLTVVSCLTAVWSATLATHVGGRFVLRRRMVQHETRRFERSPR